MHHGPTSVFFSAISNSSGDAAHHLIITCADAHFTVHHLNVFHETFSFLLPWVNMSERSRFGGKLFRCRPYGWIENKFRIFFVTKRHGFSFCWPALFMLKKNDYPFLSIAILLLLNYPVFCSSCRSVKKERAGRRASYPGQTAGEFLWVHVCLGWK